MEKKESGFKLLAVRKETHEAIRKMAYEQKKPMAVIVKELVDKLGKQ
ncbi:MAG: hypothetical protein WC551_02535 [Patescibacteria group bacterium]